MIASAAGRRCGGKGLGVWVRDRVSGPSTPTRKRRASPLRMTAKTGNGNGNCNHDNCNCDGNNCNRNNCNRNNCNRNNCNRNGNSRSSASRRMTTKEATATATTEADPYGMTIGKATTTTTARETANSNDKTRWAYIRV